MAVSLITTRCKHGRFSQRRSHISTAVSISNAVCIGNVVSIAAVAVLSNIADVTAAI